MPSDPSISQDATHRWLETRIRYEGVARAELTDPPCVIEGPAVVHLDEAGRCRVRINLEGEAATDPAMLSPWGRGNPGELSPDGNWNRCSSLIVRTDDGAFTSGGRNIEGPYSTASGGVVEFRTFESRYEVAGKPAAKYWALPLWNFTPQPWNGFFPSELAGHPLRLLQTPPVPCVLPEQDREAESPAPRQPGLFVFLLDCGPGFIEMVPDGYGPRVPRSRRRRTRRITAVVVGPAHVQDVGWSDPKGFFPIDVLAALSLATGRTVGSPWIEFRDGDGSLVRRIHGLSAPAPKDRHHACLDSLSLRNGPGVLLGKLLSSGHCGETYLRAAMNHVMAASRGTIEGRLISLCRGLETLCRHHNFVSQDLANGLDPSQRDALKGLLAGVALEIRTMVMGEEDRRRKQLLGRIADRALAAAHKEKSFGLAVAGLAGHFGLQDEAVINQHFAAHPPPKGHSWDGVLSYYRGAATHGGYIDFLSPDEMVFVRRVVSHLHDLLLRMLLKTVDYDGPYRSPIPWASRCASPDWLTKDTPAGQLGF